MEDERPISFVGATPADSEVVETHEFDDGGVITGVHVATHPGQEFALEQLVEVIRNGSPTTLWRGLDEDFLAGDGEDYDLPVRFEFDEGDVLRFTSRNTNTDGFSYHHNVQVHVDYESGLLERFTSSLRRAV